MDKHSTVSEKYLNLENEKEALPQIVSQPKDLHQMHPNFGISIFF